MKKKNEKAQLILRFLKGSKKYFAMAVAASFVTTILNALIPQIFRFTVDSVLEGQGYRWLSGHLWAIASTGYSS